MPYKTVIRLIDVARNPANGFPARLLGHLKAVWVTGDDAFGMSTSSRDGLAVLGISCVLDVQAGFTVWRPEPEWTPRPTKAGGGKPKLVGGRAAAYHDGSHLILCSLMSSARG